jgi:hypothetical protein
MIFFTTTVVVTAGSNAVFNTCRAGARQLVPGTFIPKKEFFVVNFIRGRCKKMTNAKISSSFCK